MISIIITAYNVEMYIKQAIESCLNQSYNDLEVIVVEDKSTDNTLNVINEIANKDKRIKVIQNSVNVGAGMSRRIGTQAAIGEFILLLDGDDYITDNFIESLYQCHLETGADIVSGGITIMRDNGAYDITCYGNTITEGIDKVTKFWGERIVFMNNKLIKKYLFDKVPYCPRRYIEDTPTIIPQLYFANKVAYTDNTGYIYRMRESSLTHEASQFKTVLFRLLCTKDLITFFTVHDPEYLKTIPLSLTYNNLLKQLSKINIDPNEIIKYNNEWIRFTIDLIKIIQ